MKTGIGLIAEERQRQVEVEGFDLNHDKEQNDDGELAAAAASYAFAPFMIDEMKDGYKTPVPMWPKYWLAKWWKPTPDNRIRELQKAGALIAAEIDRLLAEEGK